MNDLSWRPETAIARAKEVRERLWRSPPPKPAPTPSPIARAPTVPPKIALSLPRIVVKPVIATTIVFAPEEPVRTKHHYPLPIGPGTRGPIGCDLYPLVRFYMRQAAKNQGIDPTLVASRSRKFGPVLARQEAMYFVAMNTFASLPAIGRAFGGYDHTTVVHAIRRHGQRHGLDVIRPECPPAKPELPQTTRPQFRMEPAAIENFKEVIFAMRRCGMSLTKIRAELSAHHISEERIAALLQREAPELSGRLKPVMVTKRDAVIALRRERLSHNAIGHRLSMSANTVRAILKTAPSSTQRIKAIHKHNPASAVFRDQILDLVSQGISRKEIVATINDPRVTARVVRHVIKPHKPKVGGAA